MDIKTIVGIIIYVVLGGLTIYFRTNSKLKDKASDLITKAEKEYIDVEKSGGEKHEYIVDVIYKAVPIVLRTIFTRAFIEDIVNVAFDKAQAYAVTQLDKAVDKIVKTDTAIIDTTVTPINTETETK